MLNRKEFLVSTLAAMAPFAAAQGGGQTTTLQPGEIERLKGIASMIGLELSDEEISSILTSVRGLPRQYEGLRALPITYLDEPPLVFRPLDGRPRKDQRSFCRVSKTSIRRPAKEEDIAFLSVRELGHLLRTRQITSVELTSLYLARLKKYGDDLLCVVTLTEELALRQAARADDEIRKGKMRGPLHGIPCGVKDLFATKGIPTTWGADPYRDQVFDYDAAVVSRLEEAGAVLLAKLSMGALAQGDVWFKGRTKNPWDKTRGSSGSSAGSACATAAGLVAFAIGTETLGSICSPSERCRTTGLRPTYGRVSRYGAMAVSWTMDKIGPICRSAEDCALVFSAIQGADPRDSSSVSRPFAFQPELDMKKVRIGAVQQGTVDESKMPHMEALRKLGAKIEPIKLDSYASDALLVLGVEAAAAFDEFTRTDAIDKLTNSSWPITYRSNRFVPAVEYLRAQQARRLMMRKFEEALGDFDALVTTGIGGATIRPTNLTGHPQLIFPYGDRSVSLIGRLYEDDLLLQIGAALQATTNSHRERPKLD